MMSGDFKGRIHGDGSIPGYDSEGDYEMNAAEEE